MRNDRQKDESREQEDRGISQEAYAEALKIRQRILAMSAFASLTRESSSVKSADFGNQATSEEEKPKKESLDESRQKTGEEIRGISGFTALFSVFCLMVCVGLAYLCHYLMIGWSDSFELPRAIFAMLVVFFFLPVSISSIVWFWYDCLIYRKKKKNKS